MADSIMALDLTDHNKRRHTRRAYETEVSLETGSQFFTAFSQNISSGGLFIATHELLKLGDTTRVRFRIPSIEEEFDVQAEVRWIRPPREDTPDLLPGMGVSFVNLSAAQSAILNKYLDSAETIFYDDDDI